MGKANTTDSPGQGQKMIAADVVSVLLMAMDKTTISKQQYEMMSALDGTRTASGFEHQFRSITAKAKELKTRVENGEKFEPVQPAKKRGGDATPGTPRKRRTSNDEDDATPTKKKAIRIKKAPKAEENPMHNVKVGEDFPVDAGDFIKNEQNWEEEFA